MKRLLLDTSAYSAIMGGDRKMALLLNTYPVILINPVVLGELYDGFGAGSRKDKNLEILSRFLAKPRTQIVPITAETALWFAEVKRMLRIKGRPIPINDVWIAASALEHGAHLLTLDSHFNEVDGLLRL